MTLYIYTSDGSWAAASDTWVIEVPETIQNADEIEEFLEDYSSDPSPPSVEELYNNWKVEDEE